MTHRATGALRGVPRIWLLPVALLATILGLTLLGVFSTSLILDLAAWWPVWLLLALIVVLAGGRRIGRVRVDGLVPILIAVVLVVFVLAHLSRWPLNPSASRYLAGPPAGGHSQAELTAFVNGVLVISGGSSFLYEVDPLPEGGEVGVPSAVESVVAESISVELIEPTDPGFLSFSGWEIALSKAPRWSFALGGELVADLTGVHVDELAVTGSGKVSLGVPDTASQVTIDGAFIVAIPVGVPATVVGMAQVPSTWEQTSDGWRAPVDGLGWVISVSEGSVVSIEDR